MHGFCCGKKTCNMRSPCQNSKEENSLFLFIHTTQCYAFYVLHFIYLFLYALMGCYWGRRTTCGNLSFHLVGMENWTQVIRHGSRHFYLLRHLKSPTPHFGHLYGIYLLDTNGSPVMYLSSDLQSVFTSGLTDCGFNSVTLFLLHWQITTTNRLQPILPDQPIWLSAKSSHNPVLRLNWFATAAHRPHRNIYA